VVFKKVPIDLGKIVLEYDLYLKYWYWVMFKNLVEKIVQLGLFVN